LTGSPSFFALARYAHGIAIWYFPLMYQVPGRLTTVLLLSLAAGGAGCYGSCFCGKPSAAEAAKPAARRASDPGRAPGTAPGPGPASAAGSPPAAGNDDDQHGQPAAGKPPAGSGSF
jgi:hypothetical protein